MEADTWGSEEKQLQNCWLVTCLSFPQGRAERPSPESHTAWVIRRLGTDFLNCRLARSLSPKQSCPSRKDHAELRRTNAYSPSHVSSQVLSVEYWVWVVMSSSSYRSSRGNSFIGDGKGCTLYHLLVGTMIQGGWGRMSLSLFYGWGNKSEKAKWPTSSGSFVLSSRAGSSNFKFNAPAPAL